MKLYFMFTAIFLLNILLSNAQVKVFKDKLIKERKEDFTGPGSGGYVIEYTDLAEHSEFLPRCKDANSEIVDVSYNNLNSVEKFNQIKKQIFTEDEMKYLAANNCFCNAIVYSTGEIISATITFYNSDPEIELRKLVEFSRQIKEKLTFDITYTGSVVKKGYHNFGWKVFPEYSNTPKLRK